MFWDIVFVVSGLVFLVLVMAFVLNPPEAWIKKVFRGKSDL